MPFVVDANVMNTFQQERIMEEQGVVCAAVDALASACCIALDAEGHCVTEWYSCASGAFPLALRDWVADMMVGQKIKLFPLHHESMFQELSAIGIPKKDHKWVRLAKGAVSPLIVTDDIDLFHPKMKSATSAAKFAIKNNRQGPVSRYLKKKHNIDVLCPSHVKGYFANA